MTHYRPAHFFPQPLLLVAGFLLTFLGAVRIESVSVGCPTSNSDAPQFGCLNSVVRVCTRPEAAVIAANVGFAYQEWIDIRNADIGVPRLGARLQPILANLDELLYGTLDGSPAERKFTHAMGCAIPSLP